MDQNLNVRGKTQFLEENLGVNIWALRLGNDILDVTPKVQAIKENRY